MGCLFSFHCEWSRVWWCVSPLSLSLHPSLWGQAFGPERSTRWGDAIARSLPKGGTSRWVLIAFTAGSPPGPPLSSSFIQHQKDTPSSWPRSRFPPRRKSDSWLLLKLLAITLPPLLDDFPSMFFKFCMRSVSITGFPGNLRKYMWIFKALGLSKH